MARGGSRSGAGRPKGAHNKASDERQAKIAAAGETPLDVMIEAMRAHRDAGDLDKAADRAKDAAPYVHPRLTAVEATGKDGKDLIPEGTTNRSLAMAVLPLLRGSTVEAAEEPAAEQVAETAH